MTVVRQRQIDALADRLWRHLAWIRRGLKMKEQKREERFRQNYRKKTRHVEKTG